MMQASVPELNARNLQRLEQHAQFVTKRQAEGKVLKHHNDVIGCAVMTSQERQLKLWRIAKSERLGSSLRLHHAPLGTPTDFRLE